MTAMVPRSGDPTARPLRLRLSLWLVRSACAMAPGGRRKEMAAQWEADLVYRWRRAAGGSQGILAWSLGAFQHAGYLLRTEYTMDSIWQDVKFGFRSLNRSRGIVAIAILSLAVGIGANSAIFSVVDVFMLRPLPYPESDRLHMVWVNNPDRGFGRVGFTAPDFLDLRDQSQSMALAATQSGVFNLSGEFEAERLRGTYVTPGFFDVLEVQPMWTRTSGRPSPFLERRPVTATTWASWGG
jgi:hypothetical protein